MWATRPLSAKPFWVTVGLVNIFVAVIGLIFAVAAIPAAIQMPNSPEAPYRLEAYIVMTAISSALAVLAGLSGRLLLRTEHRGLFLANLTFAAELTYARLVGFLWHSSPRFGPSIAASTGVGNMALLWWGIYPIAALLALNLGGWYVSTRPFRLDN